jgi:hypothetical protein
MSELSLAAGPLSRNDVSHLAQLIEANLLYFNTKPSYKIRGYINSLGVLAGLGFSAAMACGVVLHYEPRFRQFFQMHPDAQGQKRQPEPLKNFASLMAIIINEGAYYLKCAGFPSFHEGFVITANDVCACMAENLDEQAETICGLFEKVVSKQ